MNNEFSKFHPIVNFIYFFVVISFSVFLIHPICLTISFFSSILYMKIQSGKNKTKVSVLFILTIIIFGTLINPVFSHAGVTIITYLPNDNPLTLESIIYGAVASCMIVAVICWFSCFNEIMTSDKFIYLFGKVIPSLSLILSMTLRFVPKFSTQIRKVAAAQGGIRHNKVNDGMIKRMKNGITIISSMITWSLENAIETSDSMKSRGYGLDGRTAYSIYKFDIRDAITLVTVLLLSVFIIIGKVFGKIDYSYFPIIQFSKISSFSICIFTAYVILFNLPITIEILEMKKWNYLKSKI